MSNFTRKKTPLKLKNNRIINGRTQVNSDSARVLLSGPDSSELVESIRMYMRKGKGVRINITDSETRRKIEKLSM